MLGPLKILAPEGERLGELYGCDFALIRPDHYIAWSGNRVEDACAALARAVGRDTAIPSPQYNPSETSCKAVEIH